MMETAPRNRIKIAYGSVPKDGGTFTFYRNLRPALLRHGIDLICVTVGSQQAALIEPGCADSGCVLLAEHTEGVREQARIFVDWCKEQAIDIVMAINSIPILSALPHLPQQTRVVARCANGFDEGYRVTLSGRERLQHIVALTPRLADDLVRHYDTDPALLSLIPNGIDPDPFDACRVSRSNGGPLQLGFLGRLEHRQKGVLHLPDIVRALQQQGVDFHLKIAGKGKHASQLQSALLPFIEEGQVELLGDLPRDEVPTFLSGLDIYLFTSHFEGCPNSLLEAMMAGAAPVAFQIEGTVDFILDHARTGLVVAQADYEAMAQAVATLAHNPELLKTMQTATAAQARERFTPQLAAQAYANVFQQVMASPAPDYQPLPWSAFKVDANYRPGLKALVPAPLKSLLKHALGKAG